MHATHTYIYPLMMAQFLSSPLASTIFQAFTFPFSIACSGDPFLSHMATFILRSNKVFHALGWFCLLLMVHKGAAYEFIVGGQKGWSVPRDPNFNPFNQWAEKSRFQTGDSLGEFWFIQIIHIVLIRCLGSFQVDLNWMTHFYLD